MGKNSHNNGYGQKIYNKIFLLCTFVQTLFQPKNYMHEISVIAVIVLLVHTITILDIGCRKEKVHFMFAKQS